MTDRKKTDTPLQNSLLRSESKSKNFSNDNDKI